MRSSLFLLSFLAFISLHGQTTHKTAPLARETFYLHAGGGTQAIRYESSQRLNKPDTAIHTLIIVIHGVYRNAIGIFDHTTELVRSTHQKKSTLVIAPQFMTVEDLDYYNLDNNFLYWKGAEWKDGHTAISGARRPQEHRLSSYEVMDSLLGSVITGPNFPNLHNIIVMGHSAGGQFTQRYSVISPFPDQHPELAFRFIVMNPSSYLYPDAKRPLDGYHFELPDSSSCPGYNKYPKGLEALNTYGRRTGAEKILYNMHHRDIVILLGEEDTRTDDPNLDVSCAAQMEGPYRLSRGILYAAYLGQPVETIPNSGHNNEDMINSAPAEKWIFGNRPAPAPGKNK